MPDVYSDIRYHLCRVKFDPDQEKLLLPIDTIVYADTISCSLSRISPDGRFLMYTEADYGQFPIWHKEAELRMIQLETLDQLYSPDTESYHSWSSNSRWVMISSRRENGLYTFPYIAFIDDQGRPSKPFLLPQKDPDHYDYLLYSYNIPELVKGEIKISPYQIQQVTFKKKGEQIKYK
ncbi:MAG: hypothetical protein LIP06_05680 [Tannerellaceae bacterium]|nr:hypothetical protein [Tannerellaceae bacterium]